MHKALGLKSAENKLDDAGSILLERDRRKKANEASRLQFTAIEEAEAIQTDRTLQRGNALEQVSMEVLDLDPSLSAFSKWGSGWGSRPSRSAFCGGETWRAWTPTRTPHFENADKKGVQGLDLYGNLSLRMPSSKFPILYPHQPSPSKQMGWGRCVTAGI